MQWRGETVERGDARQGFSGDTKIRNEIGLDKLLEEL
jgi:hypothetical protein